MKLTTHWQSFRDIWVMQDTASGFVTDNSVGSNAIALAILVEIVLLVGYWLS